MSHIRCTVPTPEQKTFMSIKDTIENIMMDTIFRAIDAAITAMAEKVAASGIDIPPADRDYFTFAAQQILFVRLCGGDPNTLQGGDPKIRQRIVDNGQHIIDHSWRGNTKGA